MLQPRCWLSDPLCTAAWINRPYFCCKAFYRYTEGGVILLLLLLLQLLLASDSPSRLKKAGAGTGYWSVKVGWKENGLRRKEDKSGRRFERET